MSDAISRCELFNKLATIPAPPEANEFKAEVYKVIQQMETIDKWIPCSERLECEFCLNHEQGDTLYEPSDWDGGIGFDYIRDIKYCPLCGTMLKGAEDEA